RFRPRCLIEHSQLRLTPGLVGRDGHLEQLQGFEADRAHRGEIRGERRDFLQPRGTTENRVNTRLRIAPGSEPRLELLSRGFESWPVVEKRVDLSRDFSRANRVGARGIDEVRERQKCRALLLTAAGVALYRLDDVDERAERCDIARASETTQKH